MKLSRRPRAKLSLLFPLLFLCASAGAQMIDPFYSGSYSLTNVPITGVPTHYGGMIFKAGDPNTLIIGGAAAEASGRFYEVPVVRGAGNHIVAFGTPVLRGFGAYNDGGIAYGPGGVLFYSQYGPNAVAQVKPGSNADDKLVALGPLGIAYSTGALNFVPAGYNGAGQLKVSSWDDGQFYTVTLTADGSGTYNLTGATQVATLGGGPEGFAYVPLGSPLFGSQSMLVSEYSDGNVAAYTIDANGNPVVGSRRTFIAGLDGAEGAAIDPLTGDFLFSTCGCGGATNRVIAVRGFTLPGTAPVVDLNQHGLTGSWYEPATDGQGFEIEVFPNLVAPGTGFTQVSWFTFDTVAGGADRQRWYTLSGNMVSGQPNASLTIYQNTGGNFNAPPVTNGVAVGTATLSFSTCTSGLLSYTFTDGSGRTGTIALTRITQNVTCSTTGARPTNADFAFSGNWYNAATNGQGFTAEVNPLNGAVFMPWYTYAPAGGASPAGQRWYTASGILTPGSRSIAVDIYETTGGAFDMPTEPSPTSVKVGTGTLAFQSCSAATLNFNFTGGSSTGSSGTIALARIGPVPAGCMY
jgi:hypothetical protein